MQDSVVSLTLIRPCTTPWLGHAGLRAGIRGFAVQDSMVRRWPFVSFESALRWYVMFYEAVEPHLDRMVLSDFGTTTSEFPTVVAALNQKFGTSFGTSLPAERMAEFEPRLRQSEDERQRRAAEKREMECAYLRSASESRRKAAEAIFGRLAHRSLGD